MACDAVKEYASQKAREAGIQVSVEFGLECGVGIERILARLCEEYDMSKEEAEEIYNNYMKEHISSRTLSGMEKAIVNLDKGIVTSVVELSDFE